MPNNISIDRSRIVSTDGFFRTAVLADRAPVLTRGPISEVDEGIKLQLDKLSELLANKILAPNVDLGDGSAAGGTGFLEKPLTPKQIAYDANGNLIDQWEPSSILADLNQGSIAGKINLSDYVSKTPALSTLKSQLKNNLTATRDQQNFNQRTILSDDYAAIRDYLIAYAYYVGGRTEISALTDYILSDESGVLRIAAYAAVSAARVVVENEQLIVPDFNKDNSAFVTTVAAANLELSSTIFNIGVHALVDSLVFKKRPIELINDAETTLGKIPRDIKIELIKYIENSPIPITKQNNEYFLPLFISQIKGFTDIADTTEADQAQSAKDFDVQFFVDDQVQIQVSELAVRCAAQLYHGMVLGEELDVFNVAKYFTDKYLLRGEFGIEDSRLRKDLQMYVFSNRFTDPRTKKVMDRTRPAERQMFYRQVFNEGKVPTPGNLIVNREFPKLWKVLMLESAKVLEWLRESYNPENFVSKQNVLQAMEDLQYNLSTHCSGMANVVSPLIDAELRFVILRIFQHPEVIRQVAPQERSWLKVVEKLYMEMKHTRPKVTVLFNKARLGFDILKSIAVYDPAMFRDINAFTAFLHTVEAFITTQSILQQALIDDLKKDDVEDEESEREDAGQDEMRHNGYHSNGHHPQVPQMAGAPGAGADDWDF
jgi:hypothetical protein